MTINLEDNASKYFKWRELLYLPSWSCYHVPSEEEIVNLKQLAEKMDEIREYLEKPIHVNCALRPQAANIPGNRMDGKDYNRLIGGAPNSAHVKGLAMDFTVSSITCDDVRHLLEPKLAEFNIRMEMKPGSNWVHLDLYPPRPNRYFRP
jgi:uncharacterized protein YcbK (DUF882 family)